MSTHVVGIKPPDEKFEQMLEIYQSCEKAGVSIPKEVLEFFNYEEPDEAGVIVNIQDTSAVDDLGGNSGYEVDVTLLPPDIKIIRFFNSY